MSAAWVFIPLFLVDSGCWFQPMLLKKESKSTRVFLLTVAILALLWILLQITAPLVLPWSVSNGHTFVAGIYLVAYPEVNYYQPDLLRTALTSGFADIAGMLVQHGAHLPEPGLFHNDHPVYLAVKGNHLEVVHILVEHGASINFMEDYETFLAKHDQLHEWLRQREQASREGRPLVIEDVLMGYISLEPLDYIPLNVAVSDNLVEMTELLLAKGADVNVRNSEGKTVLMVAREKGYQEIAELLEQYGAKE